MSNIKKYETVLRNSGIVDYINNEYNINLEE